MLLCRIERSDELTKSTSHVLEATDAKFDAGRRKEPADNDQADYAALLDCVYCMAIPSQGFVHGNMSGSKKALVRSLWIPE